MTKEEIKEKVKEMVEARKWNEKDYDKAVSEDPNGVICDICGGVNNFFDDYGWFYFPNPGCEKCWWDTPGEIWRKIYGTGDR